MRAIDLTSLTVRALFLAALGVFLVVPGAEALQCNDHITTNTTLSADLSCPSTGGLQIKASNITLDCAGRAIVGNVGTQPDTIGIESDGFSGITIKNCHVYNFRKCYRIDGGSGNTLRDSTANSCGSDVTAPTRYGADFVSTTTLAVTNLTVNSTGDEGVHLSAVTNSTFTNVVTHGVPLEGWYVLNSDGNTFTNGATNRIYIDGSDANTFHSPTLGAGGSAAVHLVAGSTGNTLNTPYWPYAGASEFLHDGIGNTGFLVKLEASSTLA